MLELDRPVIRVEIPGFSEKFQARKDIKNPAWYMMPNDFFDDPYLEEADAATILIYVYLLGRANKAKGGVFEVGVRTLRGVCRGGDLEVAGALGYLRGVGKVAFPDFADLGTKPVRNPNGSVRDPGEPVRDPNGSVRDPEKSEHGREGKGREEKGISIPPTDAGGTRKTRLKPPASAFDEKLGSDWYDWAKNLRPWLSITVESFADAVRLLRERNGVEEDELRAIFEFVKADDFWSENAFSPAGLRSKSKSNGLLKLDNVRVAMESRGGSRPPMKAAAGAPATSRGYPPMLTQEELDGFK